MKKLVLSIIEDTEEIRNYYLEYFRNQEEFIHVNAYDCMESFFKSFNIQPLPDVVLSDINLSGMNDIEGIKKIKTKSPDIDIIILTVISNTDNIFKSICAGASGYAMKDIPLPELKKAVLEVHSGGSYMIPSIARKVLGYFAPGKGVINPLSPKEKQIVQGLVDGLNYATIAELISVSHDTLRSYVKKIYRKLHITTKIKFERELQKSEI